MTENDIEKSLDRLIGGTRIHVRYETVSPTGEVETTGFYHYSHGGYSYLTRVRKAVNESPIDNITIPLHLIYELSTLGKRRSVYRKNV